MTSTLIVAAIDQHPEEETIEVVLARCKIDADGPPHPVSVPAVELWLPLGTVRLGEEITVIAVNGTATITTPTTLVNAEVEKVCGDFVGGEFDMMKCQNCGEKRDLHTVASSFDGLKP